jgi:hypothetical protein
MDKTNQICDTLKILAIVPVYPPTTLELITAAVDRRREPQKRLGLAKIAMVLSTLVAVGDISVSSRQPTEPERRSGYKTDRLVYARVVHEE